MIYIYLILTLVFFLLILNKYYFVISKKLNLIDLPSEKRKIHSKPIPLFGGIIMIICSVPIIIASYYLNETSLRIILFASIPMGLLGLLDDKYKIDAYSRLIISSFLIYFFLNNYDWLIINKLFFYENYSIEFSEKFGKILTVFCILSLVNAVNMSDGMNNLCISIFFLWILFVTNFLLNTNLLFILFLLPCAYFFYMNFNNKIFLGDSGSYFLATFIGLLIINEYNNNANFLYKNAICIFILLCIPGLDMIRVTIERIIKNQNPLQSNKDHFHHLLIDRFGQKKTYFSYVLIIALSNIFFYLNIVNEIYILTFVSTLYILIIIQLKQYHR